MPYGVKQNFLLVLFCNIFTPAKLQIAVYMPAAVPQPVYALPAPVPVAVAIQVPESRTTTTTTTTETPESQYAVAYPVPVPLPMPIPMPVQFPVPAQPPPASCQANPKPKACPPCPPCVCLPSCTPAFFSYCSPCHQKCRCRNPTDVPTPLPPSRPAPARRPVYPMPVIPAPVAPPVVIVPVPSIIREPDGTSSSDSDTSESDCKEYHLGRKKSKKTIKLHKRKYRRNAGDESEGNNDLVKPVLSYVSDNGDVKFETKLSKKDAMKILMEGKVKMSDEKLTNTENDDDLVAVTKNWRKSRRYNKVLLRHSPSKRDFKKGENEFVFKPSSNKKSNSVAVSFKVT